MTQPEAALRPNGRTYAGLCLVTLSTLMLQLLLTRIFSVTMWYHFAFFVVSMAMFGMTVGALIVQLRPALFANEVVGRRLADCALLFAITSALSFIAHLGMAANFEMGDSVASVAVYLGVTFAIVSVPFVFSGICVCLLLTRCPNQIGRLYGADLAGAAFGCVALIYVMRATDGPTAIFVVAAIAAVGAWLLASAHASPLLARISLIACVLLVAFAGYHTLRVRAGSPLLRLAWVSQEKARSEPVYEAWNSFSYLKVQGDGERPSRPAAWGLSAAYAQNHGVRQVAVGIDSWASTVITAFEGDFAPVDYLGWDVTNLAHHVRHDANVLVVGSGGGRDVLSALAFDQRSVTAVEVNEDLIALLNERYGEFSGHLDRDPRVRFENDEARSFIARSHERWDILQISMIDTWAATAAGAFVLTENSLYTREAFRLFFTRLTPEGVLSVSRWWTPKRPAEIYRLAALTAAALADVGVTDPRGHIAIVRHAPRRPTNGAVVATLIASPSPLSASDLVNLDGVVERMHFQYVLRPGANGDSLLERIVSGGSIETIATDFPLDISPPTDDRPFFFHTLRLASLLSERGRREYWNDINTKAIAVLGGALVVVSLFTLICIVLPLLGRRARTIRRSTAPFMIYFAGIGFGFLLIEMSQVQRLTVFLGHPTYGLSVVLSSLLLASGAGSLLSGQFDFGRWPRAGAIYLATLVVTLAAFGLATPWIIDTFQAATMPLRIAVALATLFPIGLLMGVAFPLGMRIASERVPEMTAWLWGINGATSVCASVLGVAISLVHGIGAAFAIGAGFYVVAFIAYASMRRGSALAPTR